MKHMPILSTALAAAMLVGGPVAAQSAKTQSAKTGESVERPDFEVIQSGASAELRRYEPRIVAEVLVDADTSEAASSIGFRPLANYIFGKNDPGREIDMTAPVETAPVSEGASVTGGAGDRIAMTAPVETAPVDETEPVTGGEGDRINMTAPVETAPGPDQNTFRVRFTMPSKWTMDTLPAPRNDAVTLQELPEQYVVAAGFTGARDDAAMRSAEQAVSGFIAENDLTPTGPFSVAGYDDPSVPVKDRQWQVHRPVEAPE